MQLQLGRSEPMYGPIYLSLVVLGLLIWIADIVSWKSVGRNGQLVDKAEWLLIPLTANYVITNIYVAAAGLRSAKATEISVAAVQQTVSLIQLQTNAMYNPVVAFPAGFKCLLHPNGSMLSDLLSFKLLLQSLPYRLCAPGGRSKGQQLS
jgi:hypothetical protein